MSFVYMLKVHTQRGKEIHLLRMRDPLGYTIWKGPWNQKWVVLTSRVLICKISYVTITKIEALSGQEVIHTVIFRLMKINCKTTCIPHNKKRGGVFCNFKLLWLTCL